jgi:hypothetical protein
MGIVAVVLALGALAAVLGYQLGHTVGEGRRLRGAFEYRSIKRAFRPRIPTPDVSAPYTMFDHMRVVDTHLLRAQDYVVMLGSERADPRINQLFTCVREARRVLRGVVTAGTGE